MPATTVNTGKPFGPPGAGPRPSLNRDVPPRKTARTTRFGPCGGTDRPKAPSPRVPRPASGTRRGFALSIVLVLLLGMSLLLLALSRFQQGAVVQLGRMVEQERLQAAAQAGLADITARLQDELNDPTTPAGALVSAVFADPDLLVAPDGPVTWNRTLSFPPSRLADATRVAALTVGRPVTLTGEARLQVTEKAGVLPPSYVGFVETTAKVEGDDLPVTVGRERREIRLVDLRDLFLDKYALYVKNFCVNLNHPRRRLVVEGLQKDGAVSRVYLGNRFYPRCPEFPQGEESAANPPVLLDLDFQEDQALIEDFLTPGKVFPVREPPAVEAARGQFFHVRDPYVRFETIRQRFQLPEFYSIPEVRDFYKMVIDKSRPHGSVQNSVAYEIMKDFRQAGGKPENSALFKAIVETCTKGWDYHYGYTDYSHLVSPDGDPAGLLGVSYFSGIAPFFEEYRQFNIQRLTGGKMPLLFGPARGQGVLVEGPAFLRFFKVAFFDHFVTDLPAMGQTFTLNIAEVPLKFRRPGQPADFASREIGTFDDLGLETALMSRPVDELPVNNLFFGESRPREAPQGTNGRRGGDDIFPVLDAQLRTVSRLFRDTEEFARHAVRPGPDGHPRLHLDGVTVILGRDGRALDLTGVSTYAGRGTIVLLRGNCLLANLRRANGPSTDFLRLSLMNGGFTVRGGGQPVTIEAALLATTLRPGRREDSLGFEPDHHQVTIVGQLVVDDLLELVHVDEARPLRIVHDPALFLPALPPRRASLGPVRSGVHTSFAGE